MNFFLLSFIARSGKAVYAIIVPGVYERQEFDDQPINKEFYPNYEDCGLRFDKCGSEPEQQFLVIVG